VFVLFPSIIRTPIRVVLKKEIKKMERKESNKGLKKRENSERI
jgi:hypothetical protein